MRPLVVLGPTASGKSDVAMAFARRHPQVEVVAVDAMQVYRRMDIGTAKPTSAERREVRHHCLDLVEPSEEFTVAQFAAAGAAALADVTGRGGCALLVGGTGLYLRTLTDPMELPGQFPELRRVLEQRADAEGPEVLHRELQALDPVAASRMEPGNTRRVVRALEVTLGSGRPFSSFGPGLGQYHPIEAVQIGLRWPRQRLAERIAARVERMLAAGLVDEVEGLLGEPGGLSRTARQALGYKEIAEHLEGRSSLDEAVAAVVLRTRQFAVRQERWFRRDPRVRWVEILDDPVAEVLPLLEAELS